MVNYENQIKLPEFCFFVPYSGFSIFIEQFFDSFLQKISDSNEPQNPILSLISFLKITKNTSIQIFQKIIHCIKNNSYINLNSLQSISEIFINPVDNSLNYQLLSIILKSGELNIQFLIWILSSFPLFLLSHFENFEIQVVKLIFRNKPNPDLVQLIFSNYHNFPNLIKYFSFL